MAIAAPSSDSELATDAIVPVAMSAVAAAGGYASYLHAGFAAEIATAVGLTLFTLLLLSHVGVRRRAHEARRRRNRAAARAAGIVAGRPLSPAPSQARDAAAGRRAASSEPAADAGRPAAVPSPAPSHASEAAEHVSAGSRTASAATEPQASGAVAPAAPASEILDALAQALQGAEVTPSERPAPDWAFRPGEPQLAAIEPQLPNNARPVKTAAVPAPEAAPVTEEGVHEILKRLAAQIEGEPPVQAGASTGGSAAPESVLESGLQALRATAEAMRGETPRRPEPMRGTSQDAQERTPAEPPSAAPPLTEAHARLGAIAEALACERLDIYVEPILGLADNSATHFEVSVRLRSAAGESLDPVEFAPVACGNGLLPLLDALRVRHSGAFAQRLDGRRRRGSVFSNITGESLASDGFLLEMQQRNGTGELAPGRLVLSFSQADVRAFALAQWSALAGLRGQGFRFALEGVTDLGMDLEEVVAAGFDFIKLDAQVFLQGLPLAGALLPAADLCRHLAELGLAVVVGRIENEDVRARVLGFGVLYGQGALFGGPRQIPLKPSPPQHSAA